MEMFLVLAVILGVAVYLIQKSNAEKAKAAKNPVVEQAAPRAAVQESVVEPDVAQSEVATQQSETAVVEAKESVEVVAPAEQLEPQAPKSASSVPFADREQKIPEDFVLRRHYESTRQAEREAITNPYPTDSALRRHYQSMSAINLNKSSAPNKEIENPVSPVKKLTIPEDSTLRRHFLTQVQAEIEARLFQRPTDSALRRHYDSQVKAKMQEYLAKNAA